MYCYRGLGKSLQTIALLHTVMKHPNLQKKKMITKKKAIKTVLLLAPKNTLVNWELEIEKWTGNLESKLIVANICDMPTARRQEALKKWSEQGGIILSTTHTYASMCKEGNNAIYLQDPGPDVLVIDEAHDCTKNRTSKTMLALGGIKTQRKLLLTGTPFTNNVGEYYNMAEFIQPGVLCTNEKVFETKYRDAIEQGMSKDATEFAKNRMDECLAEITNKLNPFVHRMNNAILSSQLGVPMHDVVLHVRQTKQQRKLYNEYKKNMTDDLGEKNFFKLFQNLRPVHNHPGALVTKYEADLEKSKNGSTGEGGTTGHPSVNENSNSTTKPSDVNRGAYLGREEVAPFEPVEVIEILSDDDEEEEENVDAYREALVKLTTEEPEKLPASGGGPMKEADESNKIWWDVAHNQKHMKADAGNKLILLLHILAEASKLKEKTVVFANCLPVSDLLCHFPQRQSFINAFAHHPSFSLLDPYLYRIYSSAR
jgi:SNF2 family DNA or RNA helicase